MKKQTMYCSIGLLILVTGLLALRFWYDSKCVKFQDKNMEIQTLYLLDSGRGSVLKEEADRIKSFYVTDTHGSACDHAVFGNGNSAAKLNQLFC